MLILNRLRDSSQPITARALDTNLAGFVSATSSPSSLESALRRFQRMRECFDFGDGVRTVFKERELLLNLDQDKPDINQ